MTLALSRAFKTTCSALCLLAGTHSLTAQGAAQETGTSAQPTQESLLDAAALAPADTIYFGGTIYTGALYPGMETNQSLTSGVLMPTAEAVAVADGRFIYVGNLAGAESLAGAETIMVDLAGAALYPGFTDAHAHLRGVGERLSTLNLAGSASLADMLTRLKDWAATHPNSPVITGRGWIETHWPEGRTPSRFDLDAVVSDRPVILVRGDGHALVANTAAVEAAGITSNTPTPFGGKIAINSLNEVTGLFVDAAMGLLSGVRQASEGAPQDALIAGAQNYAERGWTGLHNMSVSWQDVLTLEDMASQGTLPIRAYNAIDLEYAPNLAASGARESNDGHAVTKTIKIYMDGALGSRGAALLEPYSDADGTGLVTLRENEGRGVMNTAIARGLQIAAHAIGDKGNRLALDWMADAFARAGLTPTDADQNPRWRIEHAQIVNPTDIGRFKTLGLVASMQPSHAISDLHFAPSRLGDARLYGAYAWKSFIDDGTVVAGGSDAPVEEGSPLIEFYAAVARSDLSGFQGDNWHAEEAVTRAEALAMFTSAPAYASFREDELGTIEVGKRADLTAFDTDLMTAAPADILKAKALLTVVDGRPVYSQLPSFPVVKLIDGADTVSTDEASVPDAPLGNETSPQ